MVPIYESDLAEERWAKTQWSQYELWEKVEHRLRRNRRLWIVATVLLFLLLSSVPIIIDQKPKWVTRSASRLLAQEINRVKREAGVSHLAYRIQFSGKGLLSYQVERLSSCSEGQGTWVRSGNLVKSPDLESYLLLDPAKGDELGIPGLVESFCYDPQHGNDAIQKGQAVVGFGIFPVKDLTDHRMDRLSVLLLSGSLAEILTD